MFEVDVGKECQGCGACETLCPGGFQLVDGKSEPRDDVEASLEEVRDVEDRCPSGAISVTEGSAPEEASLKEILQRADEAEVEGAALWMERVNEKPPETLTRPRQTVDGPDEPPTGEKRSKDGDASGGGLVEMLYQGGIVAAIVLLTGYLALG